MNESQEENVNLERDGKPEVIISDALLKRIADETKQRSINDTGEFLVFILDNGKEQIEIRVGIGNKFGVSYTPHQAIDALRPYTSKGYKVIADYHCHTPESVRAYQQKGTPPEYGFSPSEADLISDVPQQIQTGLGQKPFPHLIGVYLSEGNKVCINGFLYNHQPTDEEISQVEFEVPFEKPSGKPDPVGITLLNSKFTDPRKLQNKGIISPVNIRTVSNTNIPPVTLNTPIT